MKKVQVLIWTFFFASEISAAEADTLELPFFDDFSYTGDFPADSLWKNSGGSLSRYMGKNPPSIGVLVLDALNAAKQVYPEGYYGSSACGDTVESRPVNLYFPSNKTVYLSFYFQAGGNGDIPEKQDSLCLDFYSPSEKNWFNIKLYSSSPKNTFQQEMINISDEKFLQKGFRFRFRNYFSLGSMTQKDLVGNCDFWLIDYVKLDCNRTDRDTVYNDVSLTADPVVKFGEYTSVPWKHYLENPEKEKLTYSIFYRNNDKKARLLDSINLFLNGEKFALGSFNMPSYMDFENHNKDFSYVFRSESDTVSETEISVSLVSDVTAKDFLGNNSVTVKKEFRDCYAYDDGTSEAAYGLYGEGSQGGFAAVRFSPLMPDKLKGVYMYFCPVFRDAQADYFNLKVFNCKNGMPLTEIYSQNSVKVPKNETEKFVFIPFDNPVMITDTFFIGWEKLSKEILAVGFDKNTETPNNKFYNLNGVWKLSKEKGQIMLRPAFGVLSTETGDLKIADKIKIYPNPAETFLKIEGLPSGVKRVNFYNLNAQKVKSALLNTDEAVISIENLKTGMYILDFEGLNIRKKIIKK
jgi:hypothetical protein